MPDQGPVVVIGLKEIYDMLVAVKTQVELMVGDVTDVRKVNDDHEARLRSLERGRWPLPAATVLLSVGAVVVAVVALFIKP